MAERNTYDDCVDAYVAFVEARQDDEPINQAFYDLIGDVEGLRVLDAGCGEGYVSRALEAKGASVTGVDVAGKLVEVALAKGPEAIDYRVADLSKPLPGFENTFDLVASYFVLNDVPDHKGFISTVSAATKPGGRAVFALNNPYSAVSRQKASTYFESGKVVLYQGLSTLGIHVYHYHRTMGEYVSSFAKGGFLLRKLVEIPPDPEMAPERRVGWEQVPYHIVVEFVKVA